MESKFSQRRDLYYPIKQWDLVVPKKFWQLRFILKRLENWVEISLKEQKLKGQTYLMVIGKMPFIYNGTSVGQKWDQDALRHEMSHEYNKCNGD